MITCTNNNGLPDDIREVTGGYRNISNPSLDDLIAMGRRIYEPSAQAGIIASHWEDDGRTMRQVVDSAKSEAELAAEQAAEMQAAAIADLQANGERYVAENEYILLCDFIAGTPGAHTKLGLGALQDSLVAIIATAPARQNALFQYLMGLQVALQRLGGIGWWDACTWRDQSAIVNAACERHNAIVGVIDMV